MTVVEYPLPVSDHRKNFVAFGSVGIRIPNFWAKNTFKRKLENKDYSEIYRSLAQMR